MCEKENILAIETKPLHKDFDFVHKYLNPCLA